MKDRKPWSFCETPEDKCTMNYCDENGCQNRKRNYEEGNDLIADVSVAKRKLCPTCGSDSLITLSDITYCMNDCCDGVKGYN